MRKTNLGRRREVKCKMDLVLLRSNIRSVVVLKMVSLLVLLVERGIMGNV